ncbi:uncharacterized protein LOC104940234 [Larimichthys crocea]|uniref:uncharacterized protein LOC104940234 n=1 Tax=Larimichthys crocea TaxID=215358 RepID=UPI000F5DCA07|nr:uncharacterized protein LOC104940234 [Larimichthys crocea]
MKLFFVPMVMALVVTTTGFTTTRGPYGRNLIGKMFTLSRKNGGISFYSPYLSLTSTSWLYTSAYPARTYKTTTATTTFSRTSTTRPTTTPTTQRYKTTTASTTPTFSRTSTTRPTTRPTTRSTTYPPWTTYPQWTTVLPTRGVSVCLRYLTDYVQDSTSVIFTLSPTTTPLRLMSRSGVLYGLSFNSYSYPNLFLQPNIRLCPNIGMDIWTRLCLTVDTAKNVAQVFSGSNMSVRKILPFSYVWSGQPLIDFSGFDGQVTDVQIWDYPLSYRQIYNYMVTVYGPRRGSVLTWSSISYSPRGNVIMEDVYEQQAKQSIKSGRRGRGRQLKGKKKTRKFWNPMEKKARNRQLVY